ncbi:hypothetical protein LINPERPRIM_LOCUS42777, partial [Linum perenne]
ESFPTFRRTLSRYSAPLRTLCVHPLHRPSRFRFFVSLSPNLVM